MKQLLYIVLLITVFCSCNSIAGKVITNVDNQCAGNRCVIRLKDATDFDWDKLYLFGSWTDRDTISRVIGFNYVSSDYYIPDDVTRMVFVRGTEVIREEDLDWFDGYQSKIHFNESIQERSGTRGKYLTPMNAVFKVKKAKTERSCQNCFTYYIEPLKDE